MSATEGPAATIAEAERLIQGITPHDEHLKFARYEHGGGRLFRELPGTTLRPGDRTLIIDAYQEGDREFYFAAVRVVRDLLALVRPQEGWQPIETAPPGLVDGKWTYVLFKGVSKGRSFPGYVVVSGWMGKTHDGRYEPVHSYSYKLIITHWMPMPEDRPAPSPVPGTPERT